MPFTLEVKVLFLPLIAHKDAVTPVTMPLKNYVKTFFENFGDIVYILDYPSFAFRYISPSVRKRGYSPEEIYSNPSIMFRSMDPTQLETAMRLFQDNIDNGQLTLEYAMPTRCGELRWYSNSMFMVNTPTGKKMLAGIVKDITDLKKTKKLHGAPYIKNGDLIRIFLVDDLQLLREGLRLLFSFEEDIEVVGEASNGVKLLEALEEMEVQPDIILMDVSMAEMDGVETSHLVKQKYPNIKILILSMDADWQSIKGVLDAGVSGYLLKSAGKHEVLMAIRAVYEGSSYFSSAVSAQIISQLKTLPDPAKPEASDTLSEREIEVLSLIAKQYSGPEIGEKLYISPRTVESHRRNMLKKLGLKNSAGLVKYAVEHGL